jgi:hypothetical protein
MRLPTLKTAYFAWVLLIVSVTSYGLLTGSYQSLMSLAVDKAGELPKGISHDQMLLSFIGISLGGALLLIVGSGVLVWKASKNKKWSIWVFSLLAVWQAVDSIYGNFQLMEMYPGVIGISDWLFSIIASMLWLYMLFAAHKNRPKQEIEDNAL